MVTVCTTIINLQNFYFLCTQRLLPHKIVTGRFLDALTKLRKATISLVIPIYPSVCPSAWNDSALNGRIVMKFNTGVFFENLS